MNIFHARAILLIYLIIKRRKKFLHYYYKKHNVKYHVKNVKNY